MPLTAHVLFGDIKFNIARFRGSLVAGTHLQIRRSRTQSSSGVVVVRACPCTLMRSQLVSHRGFDICPRPIRRAPPSRGVPCGTPHPRAHRHQSWEHHFQRVVDFLCFPQDLSAPGPAPAPRIPFIVELLHGSLLGKPYATSSCDFPRRLSFGYIYRETIVNNGE